MERIDTEGAVIALLLMRGRNFIFINLKCKKI